MTGDIGFNGLEREAVERTYSTPAKSNNQPINKSGDEIEFNDIRVAINDVQHNIVDQDFLKFSKEFFEKRLERIVDEATQILVGKDARVTFELFGDSGVLVGKLVDRDSGKVLKSMPLDDFLITKAVLGKYIGQFIDVKA